MTFPLFPYTTLCRSGCLSVMRSGLEIGPDAAAPRVLLIRGRFGRGNCQAYTNQCGRYQQLLPRSAVSSALLGKNLPGFLGLLHALVQGLLRSLLGFPQLAFAPPDARQVEVGPAVRPHRAGLPAAPDPPPRPPHAPPPRTPRAPPP